MATEYCVRVPGYAYWVRVLGTRTRNGNEGKKKKERRKKKEAKQVARRPEPFRVSK